MKYFGCNIENILLKDLELLFYPNSKDFELLLE